MASYDRISGSYHLDTLGGDIHITSVGGQGSVFINGNLYVIGGFSNVQSIQTLVYDNFVTLAANTAGTPFLDAGIEVDRGDSPTVGLRWHEAVDRWQVTNDGTYWANLMIMVEDDTNPRLGGNLSTTGLVYSNTNFDIRSTAPHNLILAPGWDGNSATTALQLRHSTVANVSYVSGSSLLFANTAQAGQSGLYIKDELNRSEELITKRRAVVYSLVL